MPGIQDPHVPNADFLSPFRIYRSAKTAAETDPAASDAAAIDFTKTPTASRNAVAFVVRRTSGTGRLKLKLHCLPADGGVLDAVWLTDRETGYLEVDTIYRLTDLHGASYKLLISALEASGTFSVYLSDSVSAWNN